MARKTNIRWMLGLNLVALSAASAVLLVGALPVLGTNVTAQTRLALGALLLLHVVYIVTVGSLLFFKAVAKPVDRLLTAAEGLQKISSGGSMPLFDPDSPIELGRATIAFERLAGALAEERAALAAKVDELTRANEALATARESLIRTEKLATVGRLAAGIAHEVGNPLGGISGYAEVALSRLANGEPVNDARRAELKDYFTRILGEAKRIDRTVRELLDFSRPTAPHLTALDLRAVIDGAIRLAKVQPRFKHVAVEIALPAGFPMVLADEHHLAQVMLNVLLNAGDAMNGRGALTVEPASGHDEAQQVAVAFRDTGPGIAPGDLAHIFDPFFTTKEPGKGTGLGLAITHRIMESFGGAIHAASVPGGGAVFTLVFRRAGGER